MFLFRKDLNWFKRYQIISQFLNDINDLKTQQMADKAEKFKQQNQDEEKWEEREKEGGGKEFLDPVTNEWVGKNE